MTAVALRSVFAEMPIILPVTTYADRRGLLGARRPAMTGGALHLGVPSGQRKMRLLRMVEGPLRPAVRRMTGLAFFSEAALVHIIVRMTVVARGACVLEIQGAVALRTTREAMQAKQGEFAEVVIEFQPGAPCLLRVALVAGLAELASMRILGAMTIDALLAQFLRRSHGTVAGMAIELGVNALQGEVVARSVIQIRYAPLVIVVAIAAFRAEASGVRVVGPMAAVAILGNFVLVVAAAMAGGAIDLIVRAEQLEAGFFEVIVFRRFPFLGGMAFGAGIAACAAMLIVGRVAADAALGRLFIGTPDVTGVASQAAVRAGQPKWRFVVIEFGGSPAERSMALGTGLGELPVMHIIGLVTADARRRGLAKCFALCMTGRAIERRVRARQLELGQPMIELRTIELHDIRRAAFVFGMAGAALADAGILHASVKPFLLLHIGGYILMAVQAQCRLRPRVRAVMAIGAAGFLLDMRLAHFARHQ